MWFPIGEIDFPMDHCLTVTMALTFLLSLQKRRRSDGQSHIDNIRDAGRSSDPAQGGTDIDLDRAELETLFGDLIEERRGSGALGLGVSVIRMNGTTEAFF